MDISECPDFNTMYELYDPCTCMFFFRNKVCKSQYFAVTPLAGLNVPALSLQKSVAVLIFTLFFAMHLN